VQQKKDGIEEMAEKRHYVTEEGLAALEKELDELKSVRRKEVAEKIKVALSFGDLSENSEYDEAKNDQAMVEARIADLEIMLKSTVLIDESELTNEKVNIGSKVEVSIVSPDGAKSKREFKIVGSNEANPRNGKISDESAVGRALIGNKRGKTVSVETPAGVAKYKIVSISR
jgi:transcription elongation factor GreA